MGIGAGDEVITVSHTAVPTVGAIREAGASPRLVDVEEGSLLIDPRRVAESIGPRTRAIVPVHIGGEPADLRLPRQLDETVRIGDRVVIEDNCVLHAGLQEDWWSGLRTPLVVGNDVIIGHGAVVHGTRIGDHVMIGMNATVLQNVEIADSCVIGAGGLRLPNSLGQSDRL